MRPATRPEKHALEFHDSEILSVSTVSSYLEVALNGYLHCEEQGRKTGWSQRVLMRIAKGSVISSPSEFPAWIIGGDLSVAGQVIKEPIQLPFKSSESCRFFGFSRVGEDFDFIGDSIIVLADGEATYVEEVRI